MYSVCPICGNKFFGTTCLKCTQQSINVGAVNQEILGEGTENKSAHIQSTSPVSSNTAWLKLVDSTTEYAVTKPVCRIGQDATNDIILGNDEAVAKFHTQIKLEDNQYLLQDLGTKEGTWLNGQKVALEEKLYDSDYIKVGSYKFYFVSDLPCE